MHQPTIDSFSGRYRFLSNFWYVDIPFEGTTYPSLEHAYQAAKTKDPSKRVLVRACQTPGHAKRAGQGLTLRADWEKVKLRIMEQLLRHKFDPLHNRRLADALVETHPCMLIEGNHWGDTFWGVCNGKGENHLGKLLMMIRSDLVLGRMKDDDLLALWDKADAVGAGGHALDAIQAELQARHFNPR